MCAALTLAALPDDGRPERNVLKGRTEPGRSIQLVFLDGELHSVDTQVSLRCGSDDYWRWGDWTPAKGIPGVRVHQEDRRFQLRQKGTLPDFEPPVAVDYVLRGELADGEDSAEGTLAARVLFGRGRDAMSCRGTVRFSATS